MRRLPEHELEPACCRVYFFMSAGAIKIGTTCLGVEQRRRQVQGSCPSEVAVLAERIGNRNTERAEHARWASLRLASGREWFRSEQLLLNYLDLWRPIWAREIKAAEARAERAAAEVLETALFGPRAKSQRDIRKEERERHMEAVYMTMLAFGAEDAAEVVAEAALPSHGGCHVCRGLTGTEADMRAAGVWSWRRPALVARDRGEE